MKDITKHPDYFNLNFRFPGEVFKKIHNYILDLTEVSSDDNYASIRGLDNFIIRDIDTYTQGLSGDETDIYDYNTDDIYPMYGDVDISTTDDDNLVRPISLGNNQFPVLSIDATTFINEG